MEDKDYFNAMINSSQEMNPAYGYLWWLDGKTSFMAPATGQTSFNGSMTADAPGDMFAAIGKSGQFINIIPSENIVVIRMGESTDNARVALSVQNNIWERLRPVINP
jgi:CubicO group peptidase (beta-lactamase class C family)